MANNQGVIFSPYIKSIFTGITQEEQDELLRKRRLRKLEIIEDLKNATRDN